MIQEEVGSVTNALGWVADTPTPRWMVEACAGSTHQMEHLGQTEHPRRAP